MLTLDQALDRAELCGEQSAILSSLRRLKTWKALFQHTFRVGYALAVFDWCCPDEIAPAWKRFKAARAASEARLKQEQDNAYDHMQIAMAADEHMLRLREALDVFHAETSHYLV